MGWFLGEAGGPWAGLDEYLKKLEEDGAFIPPGDLVQMIRDGAGPASLQEARQLGLNQHDEQRELEDGARRLVAKLESAWTGSASDAARANIQPLATVAEVAAKTLKVNSEIVQNQVHSFDALKANLHQVSNDPPEKGFWDSATPWDTDTEDQINQRDQQVSENSEKYSAYVQTSDENKTSMVTDYGHVPGYSGNDFEVEPRKPGDPGDDKGDPDGKYQIPKKDDSTSVSGFTGHPTTNPPPNLPPPVQPPHHPPVQPPNPPVPIGTTPSGYQPPRPVKPAWPGIPGLPQGGPGGFGPRGGGAGGDFGAGAFGPGGGIPSAGVGGGGSGAGGGAPGAGARVGAGGLPGAGGPAAPGGAPGGSGSGAGARGGGMGGGGGGGGGGRGQGGEDGEHRRASYLEEADPDAIFGTDERTAPPVIGQ